jgi:hypothetical protein
MELTASIANELHLPLPQNGAIGRRALWSAKTLSVTFLRQNARSWSRQRPVGTSLPVWVPAPQGRSECGVERSPDAANRQGEQR